jgi:hypothetical protein
VLAGITGGPIATLVHLPTRALVWWVATVARVAARAPLGELRARHLIVLSIAAVVFAFARTITGRHVAVVLLVVALLQPPLTFGHLAAGQHPLAAGISVLRGADGTTVLTVHDTSPGSIDARGAAPARCSPRGARRRRRRWSRQR